MDIYKIYTCIHLSNTTSIFVYAITVSLHVCDIMYYNSDKIHRTLLVWLSVLYTEVKNGDGVIRYRILLL